MRDIYSGPPLYGDTDNTILLMLWGRMQAVVEAIGGGGGGGTVRTAALTAAVASGSVTAGAKSVSFSSSSDFAGTIGGAAFGASQALVFAADGADTIGAIAYTRSAGTLYIATLT